MPKRRDRAGKAAKRRFSLSAPSTSWSHLVMEMFPCVLHLSCRVIVRGDRSLPWGHIKKRMPCPTICEAEQSIVLYQSSQASKLGQSSLSKNVPCLAPISSLSGSNSSFDTPGLAVIIRFSCETRMISVCGLIYSFFFITVFLSYLMMIFFPLWIYTPCCGFSMRCPFRL